MDNKLTNKEIMKENLQIFIRLLVVTLIYGSVTLFLTGLVILNYKNNIYYNIYIYVLFPIYIYYFMYLILKRFKLQQQILNEKITK